MIDYQFIYLKFWTSLKSYTLYLITMHSIIFASLFLLLPFCTCAQNLVPNPGFETYERVICRRYINRNDFSNAILNWYSPTNGTPDMYSLKGAAKCQNYDYQDVINQQHPRTGDVMIGLQMPGEYIQAKLIKPLTPGKKYYVEFWMISSPTESFVSNNVGIYFSENSVTNYSYQYNPQVAALSYSLKSTAIPLFLMPKANGTRFQESLSQHQR